MPCSSTSQLTNASTPVLPLTQPTTPAQWNYFVARLQDIINAVSGAANRQPVNVVPVAYAVYNGSSLPALTVTGATAALDTTKAQFGKASLKLTATAATVTVSFTGDPIVIQPFARWIESVYTTSSRTSITGTLAVVTAVKSYPVDISGTLIPATWGRLYGDCDLTADNSTAATLTLTLTGCTVGDTFNLEGWQLEQSAGTSLPSPFINSAAPASQTSLPDDSNYSRILTSHTSGNVAYNFKGVWGAAVNYLQGDEVVYSGSYWLALSPSTNNAPAQGSANWQVVGAYNNYQGAWSSATTYYAGQETTYNGNYWVAAATNTNSAPSISNANWIIAGPQNLDKVPDGTARFAVINGGGLNAVAAVDPNKRALIDATQAGHVGAWNLDSRVADGTNFQRVGSGYADPSGRIVNLWDGTAVRSAVNTWDGANRARTGLQSSGVIVAGIHPLDNILDTTNYARRAAITGTGGDIEIDNAQFTLGAGNAFTGWTQAQGDLVYDSGGTSSLGTRYMAFRATSGNGAAAVASMNRKIAVTPGDVLTITALLYSPSAGFQFANVSFYTASGASAGPALQCAWGSASWGYSSATGAVPVNAAYGVVSAGLVNPSSGSIFGGCGLIRIHTNDLRVAGSGQQLGDQRNAPSSLTRNLGLVRSSTALTVFSTGAVNVNAHSIQLGGANIPYNAVTNAVTGLSVGSSYYIYTNDNYAGGTQTWSATTSASTANNNDTAYNAGQVTVPSSGSGGGGGGGGCVCADMWLRPGLTARDLAMRWRWWRPYILRGQEGWHFVRKRPVIVQEPCVRLTVADGSYLDCSTSTPVIVRDGARLRAPDVYGREMFTDHGWQRVIECELLPGLRDVVRTNLGQHTMLAGADPQRRLDTHNWKP